MDIYYLVPIPILFVTLTFYQCQAFQIVRLYLDPYPKMKKDHSFSIWNTELQVLVDLLPFDLSSSHLNALVVFYRTHLRNADIPDGFIAF